MKDQDRKTPPCQSARYFRLTALITLVCALSILLTGAILKPDPSGTGTHCQLRLPSCSWIVEKGIPCPSCGMTTSVSFFMHGKFLRSLDSQAFGTVMSVFLLAVCLSAIVQLATGKERLGWFLKKWRFWLVILVVGMVLGWIIKLTVGYSNGIYPTH